MKSLQKGSDSIFGMLINLKVKIEGLWQWLKKESTVTIKSVERKANIVKNWIIESLLRCLKEVSSILKSIKKKAESVLVKQSNQVFLLNFISALLCMFVYLYVPIDIWLRFSLISVISFLYIYILHHLYNKFWFALSLSLFYIASLIAYQVIWVDQEMPHDDPLTLFPESRYSTDPPFPGVYMGLQSPCDYTSCAKNLIYSNCESVSPDDFKVWINPSSINNWSNYDNLQVTCSPIDGLFEENANIDCFFNSTSIYLPYTVSASYCSMKSNENNSTKLEYQFFTSRLTPSYCIKQASSKCTEWKEIELINKSFNIRTTTTGLYNIVLALDWNYSYEISNGHSNSNKFGESRSLTKGIIYTSTNLINVSSKEKVDYYRQKAKERTSQFILAIFVLFTIPTAINELKKLWENKE